MRRPRALLITAAACMLIPTGTEGQRPRPGTPRHEAVPRLVLTDAAPCLRYGARTRRRACPRPYGRGWDRTRWFRVDWPHQQMTPPSPYHLPVHLGERALRGMIGPRAFSRVRRIGRREALRGRLSGRWHSGRRGGSVLLVSIGGRPVAQLRDYDRDGLVDDVLLRRRLR